MSISTTCVRYVGDIDKPLAYHIMKMFELYNDQLREW